MRSFCKIQKIKSVDNPRDKEHWMTFAGETLGYGFMVEPPKIGEPFYLYAVDDIESEKMIWTSEVAEIVESNDDRIVIKTMNSYYAITGN